MRLTNTVRVQLETELWPSIDSSSNDSFTFWKLPEDYRIELEPEINGSLAAAEFYLLERYVAKRYRRPRPSLRAYYALKPAVPSWLRHRARWINARLMNQPSFPGWPYESTLLDLRIKWLRDTLTKLGRQELSHVSFWPYGKNCCVVLTHDVEGPLGIERMEAMADIEETLGFTSAWNIPLDEYQVDWTKVHRLQARGFEFGAHGLRHDGRLFRNLKEFSALKPRLESLAREHGMRGFRSPSTLRRIEWLTALDFDFDSTLADTDPYEPQPGGCCSIFPFFLAPTMVELPYTLPQDHTLTNILRRDPLPVWTAKAQWIAERGGMVLTLTHPDYSGDRAGLTRYAELLKRLADLDSAWRALPSEVASWWRTRASFQLRDTPEISAFAATDERIVARRVTGEPQLTGASTA